MNRRDMLKAGGNLIAGLTVLGTATAHAGDTDSGAANRPRKKILAIGAHPDDNESSCGGTLARLAAEGHEVVSVYFTRGERGIKGTAMTEAAAIRTQEAIEACRLIGIRPVFMTQIDGGCEIVPERYQEMTDLIMREKPDIVLTHWPIDTHRDHAICSILVFDTWKKTGCFFDLYYYEPMMGNQAQNFHPSDYVDITDYEEIKRKMCYCHKSQEPLRWYDGYHMKMMEFRGMEMGIKYAEGFVRVWQGPSRELPGLK